MYIYCIPDYSLPVNLRRIHYRFLVLAVNIKMQPIHIYIKIIYIYMYITIHLYLHYRENLSSQFK